MNRNSTLILIIVVLIVAGGIFYIRQYIPKYEWKEQYEEVSEEPYGMKVFYNLLKDKNVVFKAIKNNFNTNLDTLATNASYVVFGDYLHIDSLRAEHILKFVENGNTAFIAAKNAPLEITRCGVYLPDSIYPYNNYLDSSIHISYANNKTTTNFHHQFLKDTTNYYWHGYNKSHFNDSLAADFYPLSYLNDTLVNGYYFNYREGKVVVCSTPILFTNYNLIQEDGFTNANIFLALLNTDKIYWDAISQKVIDNSRGGKIEGSPLQFLFSDKTLKWGWYLFLFTIVLYLFFRSKREQRIIPVLPKNTNTSIAYTKAIGVLYFKKGQHKLIANEMYIILMAQLRNRYNLIVSKDEKEWIPHIALKSGIKEKTIMELFKNFRNVRFNPMANSKDLIKLHNALTFYYKNCN